MNDKKFFDYIRASKLLGSLSTSEVRGLDFLLAALKEANYPLSWAAYALATAYHETAGTMMPISEYGGPDYFTRLYDIQGTKPERAKKHGNTAKGDGAKYHGRGYVQLTWKNNYIKAGNKLGVDLVNNPELAKDPAVAAKIMVMGMKEGWFTGVNNNNFLPTTRAANSTEFKLARKIINGTDKAEKIAGHALVFQEALKTAEW